jgi:hypothetical protein
MASLSMTPLEALAPCGISSVCKHAIAVSTSLLRLLAYAECWFISQREAWVDREVVVCNGFGQVIHGFRKAITFWVPSEEKRIQEIGYELTQLAPCTASASAAVHVAVLR